ncbi:MAG: hypothetical protein ACRDFS_05265 [Chloroflexota bacterium]
MIPRGQVADPLQGLYPRCSGLTVSLRERGLLLWEQAWLGSPLLVRIGLITLGLAISTILMVSPGHFRPAGTVLGGSLVAAGTLLWLAITFVAVQGPERFLCLGLRRFVAGGGLAGLCVLSVFGVWDTAMGVQQMVHHAPYVNDGAVMDLYAANRLLQDHDPYIKTNIVVALAAIDAPATTTTPLMDGQFRGARSYPSDQAVSQAFDYVFTHRPHTIPPEFESKYSYPAGSFLFILPFAWMGFHDMRFLYLLALVLAGFWLSKHLPHAVRPLAPLLILANVPLMLLTGGNGQPDPLYGLFLLLGYAAWRRRWISPLAMGLAIANKQLAWFFVPFYLIVVWRKYGLLEATRRTAIMAGVFLAFNIPFMIWSPSAFLSGVTSPMADPMFPLGIGLIAAFVPHGMPVLPKVSFTVLEGLAWLGGIAAFARWRQLSPAAGIVLAALPLFFAWRSLFNYFYLIPLLALGVSLLRNVDAPVADAAREAVTAV